MPGNLRVGATLTLKDELSAKLNKARGSIKKFSEDADKSGGILDKFRDRVQKTGKKIGDWFGDKMKNVVKNFFTSLKISSALGSAALTAFATKSLNNAAKFDSTLRSTTGLLRGAGASSAEADKAYTQFGKDVLGLAPKLAKSPQDLAESLYDIVSGGFEGAEATKVLEAASKGAAAGLTDTKVVANALVKTLAAYGKGGGEAARINDLMFQSVNLGIISFEELAQQIGDVVGLAATARVPFEDLMASIAVMTRKGLVPAEAFTSLNQLMLSIISPGKQEIDAAKELWGKGFEEIWSGKALAKKGLSGVMASLTKILKPTKAQMKRLAGTEDEGVINSILGDIAGDKLDVLTSLFGNVRALRGALLLSSTEGYTLPDALKDMNKSTGATDRVMAEAEKTFTRVKDRIKAIFDVIRLELARGVLPALGETLTKVGEWFQREILDNPAYQNAQGLEKLKMIGKKIWEVIVGWWENNKEEVTAKVTAFFDWLGNVAVPKVVEWGTKIGGQLLPAIIKGLMDSEAGNAIMAALAVKLLGGGGAAGAAGAGGAAGGAAGGGGAGGGAGKAGGAAAAKGVVGGIVGPAAAVGILAGGPTSAPGKGFTWQGKTWELPPHESYQEWSKKGMKRKPPAWYVFERTKEGGYGPMTDISKLGLNNMKVGELLGAFGKLDPGLPPQRPGKTGMTPVGMALGGTGTVRKPTLFLAGEAGAEDFAFAPRRNGGLGGAGVNVTINTGDMHVREEADVRRIADEIASQLERRLANSSPGGRL